MKPIGVLGSAETGDWGLAAESKVEQMDTEHGVVKVRAGFLDSVPIVLIVRGQETQTAAHAINHRANFAALMACGVTHVLATGMVGGLSRSHVPGSLMVPDQLIDCMPFGASHFATHDRYRSYDFTEPYSPFLRTCLVDAALAFGVAVQPTGCYVGVPGPRFETRAEVEMYRRLGGDVIGMTGVPEASMARELELEYATLLTVVNYGAGLGSAPIESEALLTVRAASAHTIAEILKSAILNAANQMGG